MPLIFFSFSIAVNTDERHQPHREQRFFVKGQIVDGAGQDQKGHTHVHEQLGKRAGLLLLHQLAFHKQKAGQRQCHKQQHVAQHDQKSVRMHHITSQSIVA